MKILTKPDFTTIQAQYNTTRTTGVVPTGSWWATVHANAMVDLNDNGIIDDEEQFKENEVVDWNGNRVAKFSLDRLPVNVYNTYKNDSALKNHLIRNEFSTYNRNHYSFPHNDTVWLGWKNYLSADYNYEYAATTGDIVGQCILSDDSEVAFAVTITEGKWQIHTANTSTAAIDTATRAVWVDWKVRLVLSEANTGRIKVWKDDVLVHEDTGANISSNENFYFKIGVYKPGWFWTTGEDVEANKTIYYDETWTSKTDFSNGLSLIPQHCNKTISFENNNLQTKIIDGNPNYTFQFKDTTTQVIETVTTTTPYINLLEQTWIEKAKVYEVKVKIDDHPEYSTYSPNTCEVKVSEKLALSLLNCDKVVNPNDMTISTMPVADNPTYTYRFSNQNTGEVFFISDTKATIDLSTYSSIQSKLIDGHRYSVKIRITNHPLYSNYTTQGCFITYQAMPLAIDELGLQANVKENSIELYWNIANETATDFLIQKSSNGVDFTTIGHSTSNSNISYSYVDIRPNSGWNYYRVQYQNNTELVYSEIVTAYFENTAIIEFYPNPTDDYFYLKGISKAKIAIYNQLGQHISTKQYNGNSISIKDLLRGVYWCQIETDKGFF